MTKMINKKPWFELKMLGFFVALLLILLVCGIARAAVPVLFFSDLTDGPTSGWEQSDSVGAAVTVWGLNLGDTRGTSYVTCGGVNLTSDSNYAEWGVHYGCSDCDSADEYNTARGLMMTTFWLDTIMSTGASSISVTTSEGTSNWLPFFLRETGNIYFISRTGSDSDSGFYADTAGHGSEGPWLTAPKVKDMQPGDIAYFRGDGIWNEEDSWDAVVFFDDHSHKNGKQDTCMAMIAYPGEIPQLGDSSRQSVIRKGKSDTLRYWTIAKFKMRANMQCTKWNINVEGPDSESVETHIRFIGNDFSSYRGGISAVKFRGRGDGQRSLYFYGNNCHDARMSNRTDTPTGDDRAYALYFQGTGHHDSIYIGWNEFGYCHKGAVQFYGHETSDYIDHLYIHDNLFINLGVNAGRFGGGDGGSAYHFLRHLWFWNNTIINCRYDAGGGSVLRIGGDTGGGHKGCWFIWNNTFYDNPRPAMRFLKYPGGDPPDTIEIKNNIIYNGVASDAYYDNDIGSDDFFIASNNCYYNGTGGIPSWDSIGSFETNPLMVNPGGLNFHLQATSPCIDSGSTITLTNSDYDGVHRPQGTAYDIGAYEYQSNGGNSSKRLPIRRQ